MSRRSSSWPKARAISLSGFHSAPLESIARIPVFGSVVRNPCRIGSTARAVLPVPVAPVMKKWVQTSSRVQSRPHRRSTTPAAPAFVRAT